MFMSKRERVWIHNIKQNEIAGGKLKNTTKTGLDRFFTSSMPENIQYDILKREQCAGYVHLSSSPWFLVVVAF